jgi:CheY-like chemotaxis protein
MEPSRIGAPKTILIAEDEDPIRKLMYKALTSLGYEVLDTDRTPTHFCSQR